MSIVNVSTAVILYPKTNNNEHRRAPALSSERTPYDTLPTFDKLQLGLSRVVASGDKK
jgi:hypothetical protein